MFRTKFTRVGTVVAVGLIIFSALPAAVFADPANLIPNPLLTSTTTPTLFPDPATVPTNWHATSWGDASR